MSKSGWIATALLVAFLVIAGGVKFWPDNSADLPPVVASGISHTTIDDLEQRIGTKIDAVAGDAATAHDRIGNLTPLIGDLAELREEVENIKAERDRIVDEMGGQVSDLRVAVEAQAVRLDEVQNDDGSEVRIGFGFTKEVTDAVAAANSGLVERIEALENQPASTDEGGILRNHAGALAKIEDRLKVIDDNIRWSDKKRENDRHCHVAHSDEPFGACIKAHPAETDVTKPH